MIRFEATGLASIEEHVTLREGERGRRIEVTFASPAPPLQAPPPPPPPGTEEGPARPLVAERPVPAIVWVLGGAGLVTAGVGGYFQLSGMSKRSDLDSCAPRCAPNDVNDAHRTLWIGNVVLGVGVVALAAAAVFYFTRPTVTATANAASAATAN